MEEDLNQCVLDYIANGEKDTPSALECINNGIKTNQQLQKDMLVIFFLIYSASLVFLMQAGFAMICSGCVRKKNVQNTMLKNLLDTCGSSIAFFVVGYAFAYGGDPTKKSFIGYTNFLLMDNTNSDNGIEYAHWLFQFSFAAAAATIVAGTLAERCQMNAYLMYSMMLTGFVYPVVVHNIWSSSGYLSCHASDPILGIGMIDFAGSGVVHVTGGCTALVATTLLGPRKGRFYDERGEKLSEPKHFHGHSKSLQMLGTFILWFGWYGFNAGSAIRSDSIVRPIVIAKAVVNTTLSGSASGIVALLVSMFIAERRTGEPIYKISAAMNGALTGLAAITGSCGVVEPWAALVIGTIAGLLYIASSAVLVRFCIDDAVDAIPVHLVGGSWGVISTGLFSGTRGLRDYFGTETVDHVGWFYSIGRGSPDASLLCCQIIGLLFIIGWTLSIMTPFFIILNYYGLFRADSLEEVVGLDISYHGWTPASVSEEVTEAQLDAYFASRGPSVGNQNQKEPYILALDDESDDLNGVDRIEP